MFVRTKKTAVKRRTADMTTAKRKIHASPLCERYGGVTEAGGGERR